MNQKKYTGITIITVMAIMGAWIIATECFHVSGLFLPSIKNVWNAFLVICRDGYKNYSLLAHLGSSLFRLLIAFLLAVVTAVPLGLLSGCVPQVRAFLEPIINFYRPLPPLAYYTLLVLWFGIGNESKILLLYLACFAPIYIACSTSVMKIDVNYVNNAKMMGANNFQIFTTVIFPYVMPDMFTGMRTALGVGYTTLVAAEMVAARSGIGWLVLDASNYLRSDIIFVGIIIMGGTGIILDGLLKLLEKAAVPWKGKN